MTALNDFQLRVLEKEMITCSDVTDLLGEYTDRELSPTLRARVDAHICSCSYCKEIRDTYQLTVELAGELKDRPMSAGVQNRLRKALNEKLGLNLRPVDTSI